METVQKPYVIAISAVSGGGKTTVTERLAENLGNSKALYFDDYEFDSEPEDICEWVEKGADPNEWNLTPLARDIELFIEQKPSLDYIVMDYPFAYSQHAISPYLNLTVFIDTPLDIAMARRLLRDYKDGTIENVREDLMNYLIRGRFAYTNMLRTTRPNSDVIVDGSSPPEKIVEIIIDELQKRRR